ncbi:hypothetical protein Tco_1531518 [Tanacetum coccineum]
MSTLKFTKTYNMVAFLEKSAESEGFEKISDFLNVSTIKYALTINPTVYVSCVDQFWSTGVIKKNNGDAKIHALIDEKKIVVSEATIESVLQFVDDGGVECLPTTTIFEELGRIGYEKLLQKLTTVASAIICLATNQKFNFSKYILEEGLSSHHRKYTVPCHNKKIFANMKRVNKDFSGNTTPLFPTMAMQAQTPPPTITPTPTIITSTPTPTPPQATTLVHPSQLQKQRVRRLTRKETKIPQSSEPTVVANEDVPTACNNPLSAKEIATLKKRVNKLERRKKSSSSKLKRLFKGRSIDDIDEDARVTLDNTTFVDKDLFRVHDLEGEEVFADEEVRKTVDEEMTLA